MFTGLVETTGTIVSIRATTGTTRITVAAPAALAARLRTGDSVAVNGVCLTALDIHPEIEPPSFSADLAAETIARTTLSRLRLGSTVNLELPTPAGAPLGGHVVQGHVDGTATLTALTALNPTSPHTDVQTTDWRLHLSLPEDLAQNAIPQGSITVEGISLTVAALRRTPAGADIEIAVIPHTWNSTSLQTLKPGDPVNVETDVLARYAAAQQPKTEWLTASYLRANGY